MFSKITFAGLALLICSQLSYSQTPQNLGMPVNTQLTSESNPSVSGNGRTMILLSTSGEDNQEELVITTAKSGVWTRPVTVPNLTAKSGKVLGAKDYILSQDGNTILFSINKYGGVGGTDIWIMQKQGETWLPAINPGKPINSIGNESDPSLSPDGKYLYFVRSTDKKSPKGSPCGKIFISERNGDLWKEPKELPVTINSGCECSPRISADNQTLYFSSARAGGKGGLDLYKSTMDDNGNWSTPLSLTVINTPEDDKYISIPATGDFAYYTGPGKQGTDIFRISLPEALRPKKTILVEGIVKDESTSKPLSARAVIFDTQKNKLTATINTDAAGKYQVFLTEGSLYDFSISANDKTHTFYSTYYDLASLDKFKEVKNDVSLPTVKSGVKIVLNNLAFDDHSQNIASKSNYEILRMQRVLNDNPTLKGEIAVYTDKVLYDSIQTPELSQVIVDSIEVVDVADSTGMSKIRIAKKTFHNDLTQPEANVIANALIKKGIQANRITAKGYGDKKPFVVNTNEFNKKSNQKIEFIFE